VFTARYALSPYIKQIRFVFKGLIYVSNAYFSGALHEENVTEFLARSKLKKRPSFVSRVGGRVRVSTGTDSNITVPKFGDAHLLSLFSNYFESKNIGHKIYFLYKFCWN
jgi:hypothetical protein